MKKLITILLIGFAFVAAPTVSKAQYITPSKTTSYGNTLDTVVNTAAKSTNNYIVPNWRSGITAQAVVTKISGTVGGSIGLYGSMDGTNWSLIGSASTPSDASANYSFNTTVRWWAYKLMYTGTGVMSASVRFFILPY